MLTLQMSTANASPFQSARLIAADIKLAHSVFAMPFALLGACMAAAPPGTSAIDWKRFAAQLVLIVLAMVFARTVAMIANRLLDRDIDKLNPRTASRAIPSGRLPASRAFAALLVCAVCFLTICTLVGWLYHNWWPVFIGPFVLLWISSYAWLKRFTALCHIYLGSSLAVSPLAAAIAINPSAVLHQPALWLLSAMVLCWVAGFDIIYALQDVDIDRAQNLHSIPAQLGVRHGLWISRGLHGAAVLCVVAALWSDPRLNALFGVGIALVSGLLIYEHLTVGRWGNSRIALAFFTLNGIISCILGGLGIVDVLVV